ncbi:MULTISPECIES: tyrosinase family protein [unclassified Ensifer]|uniref:tyrosinase family protein n=1 Tax=unclassified Ensifer TaxID=2633371 RepID=UPI0007611200|nr:MULTISPECIES: tyrosinase family protein [unclassified Ensifer]
MQLSRRELLATGVGAVAAISLMPAAARTAVQRVRFGATTPNGKSMLEAYAKGVAGMKALSGADPKSWLFQWYTHWVRGDSDKLIELANFFGDTDNPAKDLANLMWSSCQPHGSGMNPYNFLPWHRACLLYFEEIVRHVSGVEEFTLPYWDYTMDGVLPEEFRRPGDPVWGVLYVDERRASVNTGASITTASVNLNALRNPGYYESATRLGFNNEIDGGIHGAVHVNVGTTQNMGSVDFAGRDPIFWLHHCNIDRLWAAWNQAGRANPTDAGWTDVKHVFADKDGNRVEATNGKVSNLTDVGYSYDTLPPVPSTQAAELTVIAQAVQPLARNAETVKLGQDVTTATLAPLSPAATATLGALGDARLLLVMDGVTASAQPGTVFDVYGKVGSNSPDKGVYLGSVNFFDAVPLGQQAAKPKRLVFDVTDALGQANVQLTQIDVFTYYFVPVDPVAAGSDPVIQRVELVRETAPSGG